MRVVGCGCVSAEVTGRDWAFTRTVSSPLTSPPWKLGSASEPNYLSSTIICRINQSRYEAEVTGFFGHQLPSVTGEGEQGSERRRMGPCEEMMLSHGLR